MPDRRRLAASIRYACTEWRLPRAAGYWSVRAVVGTVREVVYPVAGLGKVIDSIYGFGAALHHENAAKVALGTTHAYRGAERFVNARKYRGVLLLIVGVLLAGVGVWLAIWHPTAAWTALIGLIGVLDLIGRRGRPKPEAPPRKPRPLVEGMPTHLLKQELQVVLEEEGYAEYITIADVILDIMNHEYHVAIVAHTEIKPDLLRQIERRINAPLNSIRMVVDELNSADRVWKIGTGNNPLKNVPELPWIPYGEVSAWEPLPLGASSNPDTPYEITFAGQHISIIGATGAAKTTVHMNNAIDRLSACRDAVQWGATLDKPDNFEAWGDVLERTAYTVPEIDELLDLAIAEMDRRSELLRELTAKARQMRDPSQRKREWSPDLGPSLHLWFDEFPQLAYWDGTKVDEFGNKPNLLNKVEKILRLGRGLGISVGLGIQATGTQDTGSTLVAKQTTLKIVGPCDMADTVAVFGKDKRDQGYAPHLLKPAKLGGPHNDAGMAVIDGGGFGPDYVRGGKPLDVLARSMRREDEWAASGSRPAIIEPEEAPVIVMEAVTVPAGLAAVDAALKHHDVDVLSSALVVEHANDHGGRWTTGTLAKALKSESPEVVVKARDGRCRVKKKPLQCYHREDVLAAFRHLDGGS